MNRGPQNAILIAVGRQRKHGSGMAIVLVRPNHERRLIKLVADEAIGTSPVPLAPKVKHVAVLGALPVDHAMQMGTRRGKGLHGVLIAQMAKVLGVDNIEHALFSAADHQVRSGNQDSSRGVEIVVGLVQFKMVGRCEPVQQTQVRIELDEALAELWSAVPAAVSGDEINVPLFMDAWALA